MKTAEPLGTICSIADWIAKAAASSAGLWTLSLASTTRLVGSGDAVADADPWVRGPLLRSEVMVGAGLIVAGAIRTGQAASVLDADGAAAVLAAALVAPATVEGA